MFPWEVAAASDSSSRSKKGDVSTKDSRPEWLKPSVETKLSVRKQGLCPFARGDGDGDPIRSPRAPCRARDFKRPPFALQSDTAKTNHREHKFAATIHDSAWTNKELSDTRIRANDNAQKNFRTPGAYDRGLRPPSSLQTAHERGMWLYHNK